MQAHIRSILPQRNGVAPVDSNTLFLAHFDEDVKDSIQGIAPSGSKSSFLFTGSSFAQASEIGTLVRSKTAVTVSCWIKMDVMAGPWSNPISFGASHMRFEIRDTRDLAVYGIDSTGKNAIGPVLSTGQWYHLSFVHEGTNWILYVNGVSIATGTASSGFNASNHMYLSARYANTSVWRGNLCGVTLWKKALSVDQVQELMHQGPKAGDPDLVGYWKLDEGAGSIAYDYSSVGNDISLPVSSWAEGRASYSFVSENYPGGLLPAQEETENIITDPQGYAIANSSGQMTVTPTTYNGFPALRIHMRNGDRFRWTGGVNWVDKTATGSFYVDNPDLLHATHITAFLPRDTTGLTGSDTNQNTLSSHQSGTRFWAKGIEGTAANTVVGIGLLAHTTVDFTVYKPQLELKAAPTEYTLGKRSARKEYGRGVIVEEGTTNLVPQNYRDLGNQTGWEARASVDVFYDQLDPQGGNEAVMFKAKSTYTGGDVHFGCRKDTLSVNTFSASVWLKANKTMTVPVILGSAGATSTSIRYDAAVTNEWQKFTFTGNIASATGHTIHFGGWSTLSDLTAEIYIYQPQVEQKKFNTSFVDGTRIDGRVEYPNVLKGMNQGTLSFWVKRATPWNNVATNTILSIDPGSNADGLWIDYLDKNILRAFCYPQGGGTGIERNHTVTDSDQWVFVAVTFTPTSLNLYVDGKSVSTGGGYALTLPAPVITIGRRPGWEERYGNFIVDELRIDKIPRTADEIASWYYQNRNGWR